MSKEWIPEVYPKSEPIWCPHCGEEFGIETEIERAEKRGQRVLLEYLIENRHSGIDQHSTDERVYLKSMLKELEGQNG